MLQTYKVLYTQICISKIEKIEFLLKKTKLKILKYNLPSCWHVSSSSSPAGHSCTCSSPPNLRLYLEITSDPRTTFYRCKLDSFSQLYLSFICTWSKEELKSDEIYIRMLARGYRILRVLIIRHPCTLTLRVIFFK